MHTVSPEFKRLHEAQQEAFNELHGARQHAYACREHLGPAGQRASQDYIARLYAAEVQARAALDAYQQQQREVTEAAYAVAYIAEAA